MRISVYGNTVCVPTGVYSKGLSVNAGPEYCMSVSQPAVLLMTPELSWTSKVSFAFFLSMIYVPFLVYYIQRRKTTCNRKRTYTYLLERKIPSSMFLHSDAAWQEIDLLSCLKTSYETVDF